MPFTLFVLYSLTHQVLLTHGFSVRGVSSPLNCEACKSNCMLVVVDDYARCTEHSMQYLHNTIAVHTMIVYTPYGVLFL